MTDYSGKSMRELKALCRDRNLDCRGINKTGLIQLLIDDDNVIVDDDDNVVSFNNGSHQDAQTAAADGQESTTIRMLQLQREIEQLKLQQLQFSGQLNNSNVSEAGTRFRADWMHAKPHLPVMSDSCDVIAFFATWEKTLRMYCIPREEWARLLPSCLNAKASKIFAQQSFEDCMNYDVTRSLLLDAFRASADSYLHKFETATRSGAESYKLFLGRLREYHQFYLEVKEITDFEKLREDILLNVFIRSLPPNVAEFVRERQPKNATEASEKADLWFSVKCQNNDTKKRMPYKQTRREKDASKSNDELSAKATDATFTQSKSTMSADKSTTEVDKRKHLICFGCKGSGHKRSDPECPNKANKRSGKQNENAGFVTDKRKKCDTLGTKYVVPVYINGKEATGYRDSGSNLTIVSSKFVHAENYTGETVLIAGITGVEQSLKIAKVKICSPRFRCEAAIDVQVAVLPSKLPFDVDCLLGNALFNNSQFTDVIEVSNVEPELTCLFESHASQDVVIKRSTVVESALIDRTCADKTVHSNNDTVVDNDDFSAITALDHFTLPPQTNDMSRTRDVADTMSHVNGRLLSGSDDARAREIDGAEVDLPVDKVLHVQLNTDVDCSVSENSEHEFARLAVIDPDAIYQAVTPSQTRKRDAFAREQRNDPKLRLAFEKAKEGKSGYVVRDGILFKAKPKNIRSDNNYLLVLPDSHKGKILRAAHDSVELGGHLGFKATCLKILKTFYMPRSQIKAYTSSCITCQRLKPKSINERAAKLIPQINSEFGRKWIMDIVGPKMPRLSRRFGNHQYILVCVCHSTRWVELIPLPNLKAKTLADAVLHNLVARYRCTTLVYDQQSAFMSELMQAALKLLRITSDIAVAGFHAKTAICERYIRTVETILKSYIYDYKGKWHTILPWVAFQLRQTPCATLGFSAHELAFGKNFPDTLDQIKADFIEELDGNERKLKSDVISYITDLRTKIRVNQELSRHHALASHAKTKKWFDKNCSPNKKFEPGDKILVLEPTDSRKLFARWSDPKTVVRRIDDRNYEIAMDENNAVKTFHVNQLRKYNERTEFINMVVITADPNVNTEDEHLRVLEDEQSIGSIEFRVEPTLTAEYRDTLLELLHEFQDVFRPSLGKTDLETHCIQLTDDKPCVKPMYRLPEALKKPFEEEVNRLVAAGVLRECQSAFRSPVIAIKKADGMGLRLVNDYKLLNLKTVDDLYPMANPNEIISKAAGKPFVSKIDLSKAFLQVPLRYEDQLYTAWSCHLGTFCWTRMAQGLKNSPRTMQRLMDSLLRNISSYASVLLDDIVCASDSFAEHCVHLREILSRLRSANLTASISKSEFVMKSLDILGWCLIDGKITPSQKHVENVLRIPPQTTKHGVRALLGLAGYHRSAIPRFAEITHGLTELLRKNMPERNIPWEQRHTDALNQIKQILTSKPVLVAPIFDGREFRIMCDATVTSIAGILAQQDNNGIERNIAYFSRKLLPRERNYSVLELEGLAILSCVLHWHQLIYGYKILVRTDHRALEYMDTLAQHNSRIARWKIILSNYEIRTEYRKAADHSNCDGLSRIEFD